MAAKRKVTKKKNEAPKPVTEKEQTIVPLISVQTNKEIANKVLDDVEGMLGNFVGDNANDHGTRFSNQICMRDWEKLRAKYVI